MMRASFQRSVAITIVALVGLALVLRVYLSMPEHNGIVLATIWDMARYFTILTNALVAIILVAHIAFGGQTASRLAGITLAISIVGVVYHLLLAHLQDLSGLELVVDHIFHTIVPLGMFSWWLLFAPKAPLGPLSPITWLVWPLVYSIYAVARGLLLDGEYPYGFLDLAELGWAGLAQSMTGFLVAFALSAYLLWGTAILLGRQSAKPG
jgi:hypothetical protein